MKMNYPKVSIVILNWNGWGSALKCLESLYQITYPNYDIIVVDNGSSDDSIQKIKEWAEGKIPVEGKFFRYNPEGKPIRYIEYEREETEVGGKEKEIARLPSNRKLIIIKNGQNFGFAKGCNIGIRYALNFLNTEYLLLLHNDMLPAPDFLDELVKVAQKEPHTGLVSPTFYWYNEPDKIWAAGGHINYWLGTISSEFFRGTREKYLAQFDDPVEADFVPGCALISHEMLTTVGLLDEDFFFGAEEMDICIRATKHGFRNFFVPKSKVWHRLHTIRRDEEKIYSSYRYSVPGWLMILEKHWSKPQLATTILFFIFSRPIKLFPFLLHSGQWRVLKEYPGAIFDYLKWRMSSHRKKSIETNTYDGSNG